jgi:hypothetical protein
MLLVPSKLMFLQDISTEHHLCVEYSLCKGHRTCLAAYDLSIIIIIITIICPVHYDVLIIATTSNISH